jgi:hypothetical protein
VRDEIIFEILIFSELFILSTFFRANAICKNLIIFQDENLFPQIFFSETNFNNEDKYPNNKKKNKKKILKFL